MSAALPFVRMRGVVSKVCSCGLRFETEPKLEEHLNSFSTHEPVMGFPMTDPMFTFMQTMDPSKVSKGYFLALHYTLFRVREAFLSAGLASEQDFAVYDSTAVRPKYLQGTKVDHLRACMILSNEIVTVARRVQGETGAD